jgi:hypothetical protein
MTTGMSIIGQSSPQIVATEIRIDQLPATSERVALALKAR